MAKWQCNCKKTFRHQYLLIRHVRIETKEICPKCFTALKTRMGENGAEILYCNECHFSEVFLTRNAFTGAIAKAGGKHYLNRGI